LVAAVYVLWWKARYTRALRRDAIARSEAVTTGKVSEQLLPLLPGFPFNPKDARFLGSPVDLIVFDGLADERVRRVVLVEVKTGSARLTGRERLVREAVRDGRVEWLELRL
jgi:predicted Holliday junction resolvase-like endonuclease